MTRALPIAGAAWPRTGSARSWLASRSEGARLHAGVDLGRAGDAVLAPEGGIVWGVIEASYAGDTPRFSRPVGWAGYGPELVVIEGDSGAWHVLAHVDGSSVRAGERVEFGAQVATVAERGNHLHWEVRSRTKPPRGWATIEVALEPRAWLEGRTREWSRAVDGCPPHPSAEGTSTPRACRPGVEFVEPVPGRPEPAAAPTDPSAVPHHRRERPPLVLTPGRGGPGNPSRLPERPARPGGLPPGCGTLGGGAARRRRL